MKIKVIKFNNYKGPNRAHYNDSGADVFSSISVTIQPHTVEAIPTGVGTIIPDGYDIVVHCKSGLSKKGLILCNAPVDSGYRGEIHALVYNGTDYPIYVEEGQKIGQFVVRPVIYADFVEELGDERDTGAFGSTGDR